MTYQPEPRISQSDRSTRLAPQDAIAASDETPIPTIANSASTFDVFVSFEVVVGVES